MSTIYAFGPVAIGIAKGIRKMTVEKCASSEKELALQGNVTEQVFLAHLIKDYGTYQELITRTKKVYYYDQDTFVYIGQLADVKQAMIDKPPSFERITKLDNEFAIGIKSEIVWKWDMKTFLTEEGYDIFTLKHKNNDLINWKIIKNATQVGARIPIEYRNAMANIIFWRNTTNKNPLRLPTDNQLIKAYTSFTTGNRGTDTYDEILFPVIKDNEFVRKETSDDSSHLKGQRFGNTKYYIADFSQTASLTLNSEGGIAKSDTIMVIMKTAIMEPVKTLSFVNTEFWVAIEILDEHKNIHPMYIGYYVPNSK